MHIFITDFIVFNLLKYVYFFLVFEQFYYVYQILKWKWESNLNILNNFFFLIQNEQSINEIKDYYNYVWIDKIKHCFRIYFFLSFWFGCFIVFHGKHIDQNWKNLHRNSIEIYFKYIRNRHMKALCVYINQIECLMIEKLFKLLQKKTTTKSIMLWTYWILLSKRTEIK